MRWSPALLYRMQNTWHVRGFEMKATLRDSSRQGNGPSYSLGLNDDYAVPARLGDSSQPFVEVDTTPLVSILDRRLVGFDSEDPELDGTAQWRWVEVITNQRAVTWTERKPSSDRAAISRVIVDVTLEYPEDAPDLSDECVMRTDAGDKFRCVSMSRFPTYIKAQLARQEGGS